MGGSNFNYLPVNEWRWGGTGELKTFLLTWLNKINHNVNWNFTLPVASAMVNHITNGILDNEKHIAKLDSGATNCYLKPNHIKLLTDLQTPVKDYSRVKK